VPDLRRNNTHSGSIMQAVWFVTVLYSGLLGLLIYYYSGRKFVRSVAHC